MPRSHRSLTQTGWFPEKTVASRSFGTTPPARPFLEFDGLAGTPPNLGGEFQTPNCQFIYRPPLQCSLPSRSIFSEAGRAPDTGRKGLIFRNLVLLNLK